MTQQWLHNWLYSVIPASERVTDWANVGSGQREEVISYPLRAYLTGYCRGCGKAFSQGIPTGVGSNYTETQMDIPKFGCLGPEGLVVGETSDARN